MKKIPSTKKTFTQPNRGDTIGDFWSTFGIDLQENLGAILLGKRMKILTKTGDTNATNLGIPVGFKFFNDLIYCIAGTRVFKTQNSGQSASTTFQEDTSTGASTSYSSDTGDLELFNGALVSTDDTNLYSFNGSTWTSRSSGLGSTQNHQMCYFKNFDRLYVTENQSIESFDTSWNRATLGVPYSIDLSSNFPGFVTCLAASSDRIWIGMKRNLGGLGTVGNVVGECCVYEWDGISSTPLNEYPIPAQGIMSIVIRNTIPIVMDSNGVLREYNGTGFKEIGRLPLKNGDILQTTIASANTAQFIHPKGMVVTKENTILALICNRNEYLISGSSQNIKEELPSGIWEFDTNGNASHKNPFTYMPVTSTSVTDYGQNRLKAVGSLANMKVPTSSTYGMNTIMAGANYYTDATSDTNAVFIDAPVPTNNASAPEGQKFGYFVTSFIQSSQAKENWKKAFVMFRQLLNVTDKIILKYRTTKGSPLEISITWVSGTSFTTTTDLTGMFSEGYGYEVEIVQGTGSGKCSHITSVVNNSGTYTVTLDETYTGVGTSTAKARIQNWRKAGSVSNQISEINTFVIGKNSPRIQIKVCMQFTGDDEILELIIANSPFEWIDNAGK